MHPVRLHNHLNRRGRKMKRMLEKRAAHLLGTPKGGEMVFFEAAQKTLMEGFVALRLAAPPFNLNPAEIQR